MKSKNKFTNNFNLISSMKNVSNNFKNSKYINPVIITLILGFSIYLLYFNDKIYVQDSITSSLNENNNTGNNDDNSNQDYLVENFDVSKYVDVCKNRNTRIYNLGTTGIGTTGITTHQNKNIHECEKICSDNSCQVFTLSGNVCYTYKGTGARTTNPIKISCDSYIFSPNNSYNTGSYNGVGYINNSYFKNNNTDLSYIDPFLIESTDVLGQLYNIENKRNTLMNYSPVEFSNNFLRVSTEIHNAERALYQKFDTLNSSIFDISRNKLYTDMFNTTPAMSNTILAPIRRTNAFLKDVDDKYNMVKNSDNLDGLLAAKSENFIVNNYRYLILTFIMVITIILLILYKSSNFINEKILIAYIIIVTFLVLFITQQLKL